MSDIKIQPSATGSGTVTITAPTTNTARVITLPDSAGTLLDENSSVPSANLTGDLPAISGASLTGLTSAQMPAGSVLQVVTAESQTPATTTANAWAASAITASITPSATSSKVLVLADFYMALSATTINASFTIFQDGSTNLGNGTYGFGSFYATVANAEVQSSINVVSSPSTTSAVEYKVYFNRRSSAGTVTCGQANRKSVITLMEIAG